MQAVVEVATLSRKSEEMNAQQGEEMNAQERSGL